MRETLVLQSHRSPLPYAWIEQCLASVREWSRLQGYDYRFLGDELFDCVPVELREKTRSQTVIATDLARLRVLRKALDGGYSTVVWMDADFLVFAPDQLQLPDETCAVGRETWVQSDNHGRLKVYRKVHNAFLMFRSGDSFLDFYADTAERLLLQAGGGIPPQFIGPKLLTALHNIAMLPVAERAAMFSPRVIGDLLRGRGPALDLFVRRSTQAPAAANLCASSCDRKEITPQAMQQLVDRLLQPNSSTLVTGRHAAD